MEKSFIPVEDIQVKFRSKLDLYNALSVDSKLLKPTKYSGLIPPTSWKMPCFFSQRCFKRQEESKAKLLYHIK